ncbi:DinB family protein [Neolewinella antarctica]|uniref:DinB-like domain-containing protein n=1 Tax=Neolewinella antarctica TaxID=442734 RepID=A0ABX0X889_9BACT|nr:DinB family protein [Neolewinella antarctica]NJC25228.1 hypothetical protein [Neolewinella antarctica]
MRVSELPSTEYAEFYAGYVKLIPDLTLRSALDESAAALLDVITHVPENKFDYAYAPGKWTVKQTLQHILDTERIFIVRALRIARGDKSALPGFDHEAFANVMDVSQRDFKPMIEEFRHVRQSALMMFKNFTEADMLRIGTVSGGPASTRAVGFIIAGHTFHHARHYREVFGLGQAG